MISVVIPAFIPDQIHLQYLKDAVQSVLEQTYQDFVISVVFNGGITTNFNDSKIISINLGKKTSAAAARNIGATVCTSKTKPEYFCFLDADDMFAPDKLEKQLHYMETNPKTDLLFSEAIYINPDGTYRSKTNLPVLETDDLDRMLRSVNPFVNSTVMIRESTFYSLGMYPLTNEMKMKFSDARSGDCTHQNALGNVYEDFYLWWLANKSGKVIRKMPDLLVKYRCNTSVAR